MSRTRARVVKHLSVLSAARLLLRWFQFRRTSSNVKQEGVKMFTRVVTFAVLIRTLTRSVSLVMVKSRNYAVWLVKRIYILK